MSEYPEWLIDRVANAMLDRPNVTMPGMVTMASDNADDVADARDLAVAVLDALRYREMATKRYKGYWAGPGMKEPRA